MPDIYVCYLSVSATFHGFKKKKQHNQWSRSLFLPYNISCSWTSDSEFEESHQDSSSVVQVSDSIKYKQPKHLWHVNIRSIFLYICFIDSRMLCTIVNKKIHFISEKLILCLEKTNYDFCSHIA